MTRTPSQTVGPFFGYALPYEGGPVVSSAPEAVIIRGTVTDGAGAPVPDALLEIWTASAGFGRCPTDPDGRYWFRTLPTGPCMALLVFARGLLKPLATRIYLPEHEPDAVLSAVEESRRPTLRAVGDGDGGYRFDVRLQGEDETVFFGFWGG